MDRPPTPRDERGGHDRLRVLVAAAFAEFFLAWPAYTYGWRHGDGERLRWRIQRADTRETQPAFRVTRADGAARVLLALGPRSTTGYAVDVVRAVEQRKRILLVVRERSPRLGDAARPRLTFPASVVVLPESEKPVDVEWEGG